MLRQCKTFGGEIGIRDWHNTFRILHINWLEKCHALFEGAKVVPERDKRKPKKKSKGSTKLCHQGWHWVDQLLRFHLGLARHRPQGEDIVLWLEARRTWISKENVLFEMAWLQASSNIGDLLWLCYFQVSKNQIICPEQRWGGNFEQTDKRDEICKHRQRGNFFSGCIVSAQTFAYDQPYIPVPKTS